ncbi:MAG: response regulator [Pseudomonadota bacterium]
MTTKTSPHILVVDDHREIRELLGQYFKKHNFRVSLADGGVAMKKILREHAIDLVVLDIMMPGEDGLSLCRSLRETTKLPVIMLTAMAEATDRVIGLEIGADDYVTKPFEPRELLARIKAVMRRTHSLPFQKETLSANKFRFKGWTLDVERRELIGEDELAIPISTGEFQLLSVFIKHPRIVLSRDQLLELTRGKEAEVFDRSVDNQVSRLRKKIEDDPKKPTLIQTVWGGGYKFMAEVERL